MIQEEIRGKLVAWFDKMMTKFEWLSIKFEYSDKLRSYLVSFSPSSKIEESDEFCAESMNFEDEMNNQYGDSAPLFCDDEKYFKLSDKAETVYRNMYFSIQDFRKDYIYISNQMFDLGNNFCGINLAA